ncbi:M99 family carboxypeptidase catalytic domain-containing protein [Desulfovibrio porci]|uniref:M14 family metallopeptidase n=1 Tax=Desulfovibrio porci TaxID=2605782 RepID=UPI002A8178A7|nr:M99 family carboxypeptidase catalytic domain-containing protein [Desulfovibrio porci]MDY3809469.1 M99 family carboxypeptidase catalytic domain-containing protein [Desulfovibrio porci]
MNTKPCIMSAPGAGPFFHDRHGLLPRLAACLPLFCAFLWLCTPASARGEEAFSLDFTTIRLGDATRAVLVVGGIQGDEPGGFSAATLLATRYEIQEGTVWVVPNLNFPSIIKRSRGLHGDMNRKFARLDENDPEFPTVRRIQELIGHPDVALVLNLHDGSGYYREKYQNYLCNPARWGQSVIIDQDSLPPGVFMGALAEEAALVTEEVNRRLIKPLHALHVHNTNTAAGDKEMEKSLSYYAVRQGKAAFGLEASKEFPVELRAYYHLNMVEAFLRQAGVRFRRDFALTPQGVGEALRDNLGVSFAENRIFLPLEDVRPSIKYLPLPKGSPARAVTTKPIMAVLPCQGRDDRLCIHYGNRTITLISPDWREMDNSLDAVRVTVDGRDETVPFGRVLDVEETARVHPQKGFRVNAIGFDSGRRDESGLPLRLKDFAPRFSVDRRGTLFRVEVYKNQNFAGMFLLRFGAKNARMAVTRPILPDRPGPESKLGF